MDSNYGLGRVYVDGKLVAIGDANAPSGNPLQATILELRGLSEGQHTVKVLSLIHISEPTRRS